MAANDDRRRSLLFECPAHIPVTVSILPAAWIEHRGAMEEVVSRHPLLFGENSGARDYDAIGDPKYLPEDLSFPSAPPRRSRRISWNVSKSWATRRGDCG